MLPVYNRKYKYSCSGWFARIQLFDFRATLFSRLSVWFICVKEKGPGENYYEIYILYIIVIYC